MRASRQILYFPGGAAYWSNLQGNLRGPSNLKLDESRNSSIHRLHSQRPFDTVILLGGENGKGRNGRLIAELRKPLGDILGVSVGELLSGERIKEGEGKDQSDKIIIESLNYSNCTSACKRRPTGRTNLSKTRPDIKTLRNFSCENSGAFSFWPFPYETAAV